MESGILESWNPGILESYLKKLINNSGAKHKEKS
jgi:hypothetical protein